MKRLYTGLAIGLGLLLLYTLALGTRRAVLEAQYRKVGSDLPFTLESALQYRRVKIVHDTGKLPPMDVLIQYPEGVENRTTYNVGSESLYAAAARAFPASVPFANRLRWVEAAWFCLGIPLLACWLLVWRRSWWAAGVGAGLYAVALSSVMRSTGQELSRENFALPILIAHFLADALALRGRRPATRLAWEVASAGLLALALASWDLIQFPIMLRMAWVAWRIVRGQTTLADPALRPWLWQVGALMALGLLHPYLRSHGWLMSPAMLMAYASIGVVVLRQKARGRAAAWVSTRQRMLLTWLAFFALASGVAYLTSYGAAYGHFGGLLWAKIRFLNVKPADPSLLSFDQRIMWVPALHSATPALFHMLFPAILYLTIPAFLLTWLAFRKRADQKIGELLFCFGASFISFWFFARFHVYLSLFACALVGVWAGAAAGYRAWARGLAVAVIGAGVLGETMHTLQRPERWGRINVYYKELHELATWLQRHAAPDPVLGNFGVSAYIAAYGKCAILLHPKFEDQVIRSRVRQYGEQLFTGTEESFRDWADALGARYYVYALGEFSRESPELQMRYFVNAMNPPATVPARLFEAARTDLTYFQYQWGNHKYAVYRILTRADERLAGLQLARAEKAFQSGDLTGAEQAAEEALRIHPKLVKAAEVLGHVSELRAVGFEHQPVRE